MIYVIAILVVLASFAGYTAYERNQAASGAVAQLQAAQAKADAELAAKDALAVKAAQDDIDAQQAAFDAGKAQAQVVTRKIYVRGQADVTNYPVFSNPVCVLPDASLQLLNSARANLRTPADTIVPDGAMPNAVAPAGRQAGNPVPAISGGRNGAVVGLRPPARPTDSSSQVPRSGMPAHPKPKPVTP